MDNDNINKRLQDQFYSLQSPVDTEALWDAVNPQRQRKKRLVVLWWFAGLMGLLFISYFILDQQEAVTGDQNTALSDKLFMPTPHQNEPFHVNESESPSLPNSNRQDLSTVNHSKFKQNTSKHSIPREIDIHLEESASSLILNHILNNNSEVHNHDQHSDEHANIHIPDPNRSGADHTRMNEILDPIARLQPQLAINNSLIEIFHNSELIRPLSRATTNKRLYIGGYIGMGSFQKNIKVSTLQEQNVKQTESPFMFNNFGLYLKRNMRGPFYLLGGLDFRQYHDRFRIKYSEIRSEEIEVVIEEIITQSGVQEVLGLATVDVTYDYEKDLINKSTQISGFIGLGYQQSLLKNLDIFAESSCHYAIAQTYNGQLLWLDQGVKSYSSISNEVNQSGLMSFGSRLGINYCVKPNTSIGIYGNVLFDLSSTMRSFDQKNTSWSIGLTSGYQF